MKLWRGAAATLVVATALSGCAIVDSFSGRVIDYNLQAEQAQEQQLLLNIVRASLRRPMQFTGLQSITGQATESGNAAFTFPFGESMHRPKGSVSPDIFGFGGTISGGPQFIVPVLDTQEFYDGILSPIQLQVFDYYLQQGFPREVLFALFVSKIVVTQGREKPDLVFTNAVADDVAFEQFEAVVDTLLAGGLSTEHVETTSNFGPAIPERNLQPSAADGQQAAALLGAYANLATAGLKLSEDPQQKTYRLQKTSVSYRFCFTDEGAAARGILSNISPSLYCNRSGAKEGVAAAAAPTSAASCAETRATPAANAAVAASEEGTPDSGGNATLCLSLNPEAVRVLNERLQHIAAAGAETRQGFATLSAQQLISQASAFQLQVRSTEGILYYLGEITRRHLYPESTGEGRSRIIQIPTRVPLATLPARACDDTENAGKLTRVSELVRLSPGPGTANSYFCENLFVVDESLIGNGFTSVSYDGHTYSLPNDPQRAGRTYQVLELAKQLLAINTSAKAFPATSVLSIITPQ